MFKIIILQRGVQLPWNTVIKNRLSKKTLKKILGDEKCSKFCIFPRGVESTQNDLIYLETPSWKTGFFFKKETWKNFGCWEISQLTRNDLICLESLLWKTLFFTSNMEKFWAMRYFSIFFKGGPVVLKWIDMPRTLSRKTLFPKKLWMLRNLSSAQSN